MYGNNRQYNIIPLYKEWTASTKGMNIPLLGAKVLEFLLTGISNQLSAGSAAHVALNSWSQQPPQKPQHSLSLHLDPLQAKEVLVLEQLPGRNHSAIFLGRVEYEFTAFETPLNTPCQRCQALRAMLKPLDLRKVLRAPSFRFVYFTLILLLFRAASFVAVAAVSSFKKAFNLTK